MDLEDVNHKEAMEGEHLRILVVEDNPADFFLLKEQIKLLNLSLETIDNAPNIAKALIVVKENVYDIIFLDLTLPDSEGLNSFTEINMVVPHIPIIVLSGMTDGKLALETVKQGAQDYLIKGSIDSFLLEKSIKYSIERKRNLDVIKQSEIRYKYLFENNPVPMWAYDVETKKFLMVNQAAVNHYGYSEDQFLSMTIFDIRPVSEYKVLEENLKNIDKGSNNIRVKHLKKNGELLFADIISHDIVVNNHKARLVLSYDVTERYEIQQDILFHADILQNITDIVIVTDLQGVITYWNKGAIKIFGYPSEEVIGQPIGMLKYQKNKLTLDTVLEHLREDKAYIAHLQGITKHRKPIWLDLKVTYMLGVDQNKQGLLWISNDITEELLNKEKLLIQKSAIEAVGVGIVITAPLEKDNPIVVVNPKFEALTGYTAKEVIGKNCRILQGENTDPATIREISECIKNQKSFDGEILNYRKNGEPFWNKLMINPIFDEEGKLINFVGFQQDVTEAKNAKEDLLYKNRELNTFIYKASHDLRSPIASLIGLVKIAKSEFRDEKILSYLSMMEDASERLDKILRTLINMISFKLEEAQHEMVNFASLIRDVIEALENQDQLLKTKITFDFYKEAEIKTDRNILSHILFQIIENAIKFRDIQKQMLEIKIALLQTPQKYQITISDNGMGIPKEYQDKVFDMFFRANESFPGSGLGLYIVKSFVEKLQGRIQIKTSYGLGTSLTIELPVISSNT